MTILNGIITIILANTCAVFAKIFLLPPLRNYFYNGKEIYGDWKFENDDNYLATVEWQSIVKLKQKANIITGSAESINTNNELTNYAINGHIDGQFISLIFKNKDKDTIHHSTFLIEIIGKTQLKGHRIYYGDMNKEIRSTGCTWTKLK